VHPFDEPYPTIPLLCEIDSGFEESKGATQTLSGVWSIANSDVFQHVHAREYTMAMENGIGIAMAAAGLPLERYIPARARVIFRRPSFVAQPYRLGIRLFRRNGEVVAIGAFHGGDSTPAAADRASVFMRFDSRIA
jgi:hypothetical protein